MLNLGAILIGNHMKPGHRKIIAVIGIFIFMLVGIKVANYFIWRADEDRTFILESMRNNEAVQNEVGKTKSIKLIKRVSFMGSESKKAYKEYLFLVSGEKSNTKVAVKLKENGDNKISVSIED